MTEEKLLLELQSLVALKPSLVPQVLAVVQQGMTAWEQGVQRRLDTNAELGILASLRLPKPKSWRLNRDANAARMAAVGLGLNRRPPASTLERSLVEFVLEADKAGPDSAARHYHTLGQPSVEVPE